MFSQEDIDTYNRVQNAMEVQQLERQNRRRGRLARILTWVFIPLFVIAATAAGVLGYFNWYNLVQLDDADARAHRTNQQVTDLVDRLNLAHRETADARDQFIAERGRYNQLVDTSNDYVKKLDRAKLNVEKANQAIEAQNLEIDKANQRIAEGNDRIAEYIEINASLENSVTQLDASVRRLESANNSLTRRNRELDRENSQLDQENDRLVADFNELVGDFNSLVGENEILTGRVNSLNSRVSSLQSQLTQARAQQVTIPTCASNYYTVTGGKLSCVARSSSAFRATQTETSTVRLPHSGTVNLKINRSGELGSDRSMEILEHAVKTIEEYMGEPIPLKGNEIRLDFVDNLNAVGDFTGVHKGTHMEILEKMDKDLPLFADNSTDPLGMIIAHEVAHYYFSGERSWLDEGAAEFLAIYSENKRVGRNITKTNTACAQSSTIRYLESQKFEPGDVGFTCNYSLGEGLFLDLYGEMQEEDFQRAFRKVFTSSENKVAGIYQVRQAFYAGSEWVQKIIDKWYGYREKPEAHWNDGTFLAYYTWEEDGKWWHKTKDDKPCALRVSYNESSKQFRSQGYGVCQHTGAWDENDDLIVTLDGKTYRAVEVKISDPPSRFEFSASPAMQPLVPLIDNN